MDKVKVVFEKRAGREWVATWQSENPAEVYKRLAEALIAKKLCGCTWVKSIKRIQRYTHIEIVVTYDNDGRDTFTLPTR